MKCVKSKNAFIVSESIVSDPDKRQNPRVLEWVLYYISPKEIVKKNVYNINIAVLGRSPYLTNYN